MAKPVTKAYTKAFYMLTVLLLEGYKSIFLVSFLLQQCVKADVKVVSVCSTKLNKKKNVIVCLVTAVKTVPSVSNHSSETRQYRCIFCL